MTSYRKLVLLCLATIAVLSATPAVMAAPEGTELGNGRN